MSDPMMLTARCDDLLKDNNRWYAIKARRKKIALLRVEVTNTQSADVLVRFGSAKLIAGGKTFGVENPAVILGKFSEFTWDFLVYALLDFHPVLAIFDVSLLLFGPFYNHRLKRQLALLTDANLPLRPGESKTAIVAFRGVAKELERLTIMFCCGESDEEFAIHLKT